MTFVVDSARTFAAMFAAGRTHTRHRVAASASAVGSDGCAVAVEGAVAALGREAGLVLIFTSGDVDSDAAASEAYAAAEGAHVVGMTGTGVIDERGLLRSGCSAIAFSASLCV